MADKLDDSAPFQDRQGTRIAGEPTGAGAEAAEGIHGSPAGRPGGDRDEKERTSLTERQGEGGGRSEERDGSEPLPDSKQHRSNYGGGSRK
jgi:hypothetical protein